MHELGIQDVLAALEVLEEPVKDVVVLGVQPAVIDVGLELSEIVQASVDNAICRTLRVLDSWGINCLPHT